MLLHEKRSSEWETHGSTRTGEELGYRGHGLYCWVSDAAYRHGNQYHGLDLAGAGKAASE